MSHVFISYSRQDRAYVEQVAAFLQEQGFNVWFDARIAPSDEWWDRIEDAIEKCAAFMIVMTPTGRRSKWLKREMLLADKLGKPVFPLLLDGEPWNFYVHVQYEEVSDGGLPSEDFCKQMMEFVPLNVPSEYNVTDFSPADDAEDSTSPIRRTMSMRPVSNQATEVGQKYIPTWALFIGGLISMPTLVVFGILNVMEYVGVPYHGWIPTAGWTLLAAVGVIFFYTQEVIRKTLSDKYIDNGFILILYGAMAIVGVLTYLLLMLLAVIVGSSSLDRTTVTLIVLAMNGITGIIMWRSQ